MILPLQYINKSSGVVKKTIYLPLNPVTGHQYSNIPVKCYPPLHPEIIYRVYWELHQQDIT